MKKNTCEEPISVWSDTTTPLKFDTLKRDIKTEVLIIGGGLAGVLCAYMLGQAGVDYVLAEADTVCSGITKNTTAKITSQHGLIYHKLIRQFETEKAALYLHSNQEALEKYVQLCEGIDCDFEKKDAYVYSRDSKQELLDELDALQKLNFPADLAEELPLPFPTAGAVRFPDQAQFHPLKFVRAIAGDLNIYEHTRVRELAGCEARTDTGIIRAEKIIVATHFPLINKHGRFFLKIY